jgi:lipopolysaccharide export system permease protein
MWHRQGEEFVHINAVQPNGLLLGVTRYRFDSERKIVTSSFARRRSTATTTGC